MNKMKPETLIEGIIVLAMLLIVCTLLASCAHPLFTRNDVSFTVTGKERINGSSSGKYLVFTETETFENSDILLLGKFDSSDVYGAIEVGETYDATVCGWRVPFLSMYRNIVDLDESPDARDK